MFCGRCDTVIDGKWQVQLPAKFAEKFGGRPDSVIVTSTEGGCVSIYPYPDGVDAFSSSAEEVSLRKGKKKKYARITIPDLFRESLSFHYGKTITIAGKGDHIELWPRPSNGHR